MKILILAGLIGFCAANKIIGGQDATAGQFPFIVHLDSIGTEAFCDGSIVNEMWILSAAHCRRLIDDVTYKVVAGDVNLDVKEGAEQTQDIVQFIPHENYSPLTMANDIMLIKLVAPLDITSSSAVMAIDLPTFSPTTGTACDIAGWGNTRKVGTNYPEMLQWVQLPVIDKDECNARLSYNGDVLPMMICIGDMEGGKDSCQGDSGGPATLANTNTQVGIVSWGQGCAVQNFPGVYTDVYYFVQSGWISDTMTSNN